MILLCEVILVKISENKFFEIKGRFLKIILLLISY